MFALQNYALLGFVFNNWDLEEPFVCFYIVICSEFDIYIYSILGELWILNDISFYFYYYKYSSPLFA